MGESAAHYVVVTWLVCSTFSFCKTVGMLGKFKYRPENQDLTVHLPARALMNHVSTYMTQLSFIFIKAFLGVFQGYFIKHVHQEITRRFQSLLHHAVLCDICNKKQQLILQAVDGLIADEQSCNISSD